MVWRSWGSGTRPRRRAGGTRAEHAQFAHSRAARHPIVNFPPVRTPGSGDIIWSFRRRRPSEGDHPLRQAGGIPNPRGIGDAAGTDVTGHGVAVRQQHIEPVDSRTFTTLLEQLQEGYVAAVAATAGCILEPIDRDYYGLDAWIIRPPAQIGASEEIMIGVQLKNTTQIKPDHSRDTFSYQFKERKYLEALALERKHNKVLALVMAAPRQQAKWTSSAPDALRVEHCCYWANLEGFEFSPHVKSPSVSIPTANVFDAGSLGAMMDRLERGEAL